MSRPDPTVTFRPIEPADDAEIAELVRATLTSLGLDGAGSPIDDPELQSMSAAYPAPCSLGEEGVRDRAYFVVESEGRVVGGGGFGPLIGVARTEGVCELRKMYLVPESRGRGFGRRLLTFLLDEMRRAGYRQAYLETSTKMRAAQHLYRAAGFRALDAAMGGTGHCACDRPFLLDLSNP